MRDRCRGWAWGLAVLAAGVCAAARAENYRIDTAVRVAGEKTAFETLTLFRDGVIYDLQRKGAEITIFDPVHEHIILLDTDRSVRTDLTLTDLREAFEKWQEEMLRKADGKHPLFDPTLTQTWEEQGKTFRLEQPGVLKYRVTGAPAPTPALAKQYRVYADTMSRLSILHPESFPPLARLEVNRVLEEASLLPRSVERTLPPRRALDKPQVVTATHDVLWQLSATDLKRIDEIGRHLATYKTVAIQEYYSLRAAK